MEDLLKNAVFEYLTVHHRGRARAIKALELGKRFGIDLRTVNEIIRQLRKDSKLIGSSKVPPFGYYTPADEHEAREYLKCFRNELMDMLQTFNRQRRAQQQYLSRPRQPELFPIVEVR